MSKIDYQKADFFNVLSDGQEIFIESKALNYKDAIKDIEDYSYSYEYTLVVEGDNVEKVDLSNHVPERK